MLQIMNNYSLSVMSLPYLSLTSRLVLVPTPRCVFWASSEPYLFSIVILVTITTEVHCLVSTHRMNHSTIHTIYMITKQEVIVVKLVHDHDRIEQEIHWND